MALALIVLALGSVVAGYVGVPAALGGSNRIEHYLEPSFEAERSEASHASERSELAQRASLARPNPARHMAPRLSRSTVSRPNTA
jgi:NADH-quinone oxidoreductase subunit L